MTINADDKNKKHSANGYYHKCNDDDSSSRGSSEKEESRLFNPAGYEPHLVDSLEKDILLRNPNVKWNKVAGLNEAKSILQEAMVLPIMMPDFFKVHLFGRGRDKVHPFGLKLNDIESIFYPVGYSKTVERSVNDRPSWNW